MRLPSLQLISSIVSLSIPSFSMFNPCEVCFVSLELGLRLFYSKIVLRMYSAKLNFGGVTFSVDTDFAFKFRGSTIAFKTTLQRCRFIVRGEFALQVSTLNHSFKSCKPLTDPRFLEQRAQRTSPKFPRIPRFSGTLSGA